MMHQSVEICDKVSSLPPLVFEADTKAFRKRIRKALKRAARLSAELAEARKIK